LAELRPYLVAMASAKLELSLTTLRPSPPIPRSPKPGTWA